MKDWDYAQLTKTASELGGPEKYIKVITDNATKEGLIKGAAIGAAVVTAAGATGFVVYKKGANKVKAILAKRKQEKKLAKEAEEQLIQELHDMDENPDDTIQ